MLNLGLTPVGQLTSDAFYQMCCQHPDLKLERSAQGELIIQPPTGGETGQRNSKLAIRLGIWAEKDGTGITFDSSTAFHLPNGADRSPDAAWVHRDRWEILNAPPQLSGEDILPGFVLNLDSIL